MMGKKLTGKLCTSIPQIYKWYNNKKGKRLNSARHAGRIGIHAPPNRHAEFISASHRQVRLLSIQAQTISISCRTNIEQHFILALPVTWKVEYGNMSTTRARHL